MLHIEKSFKWTLISVFTIIIIALAVATFVEQRQGSAYAQTHIYYTWWFCGLWGMLAVMTLVAIIARRMWHRVALFLVHVSFFFILGGALLSFLTSHEGTLHLRRASSVNYFFENGENVVHELPFTLTLDSFRVVYYAGTMAPSDFESRITCRDAHGEQAVLISMNNILYRDGYRFYQQSYDADLDGSILRVKYDPWGTPVTYWGYALFSISMVCLIFSRREEFLRLLRHPAFRKGGIIGLFVFSLLPASATTRSDESVPTINVEKAEKLKKMQVVWNDRVMPFNTLALQFIRKIYGSDTYRGLTAEQVLVGWSMRPDVWKLQPMIKVKSSALREHLGVKGRYIRFVDLFTDSQEYKLNTLMLHGQEDPSLSKAIRELDEKVGIMIMATNGELIQPLPKDVASLSESKVRAELVYNAIPFSKILFMTCLTLGIILFVLMASGVTRRFPFVLTASRIMLYACLVFHSVGYALRWYVSGRIPLGNGYETMLFMSLCALFITAVMSNRLRFMLPFGFLIAGFTLLVSWLGQQNPQITNLMPVLNSPLLSAHVSVIMVAYALLAFILLDGVFALTLTARNVDHRYDASIEQLTVLSRLMLYPAEFLLGVGIFLGAVWANVSWGNYWSWDPKEVWALITFMVYGVAFHSRSLKWLRSPVFFHAYLTLAFIMVLMTYFGVNYFLGGMHSYA